MSVALNPEQAVPQLKVSNLVTGLQSGVAIVDGISFEIAAGETFALLGESGCGKSMTALSLMRLLPDGVANLSGEIALAGKGLSGLPEREMRTLRGGRMAMIFQEPGLSLNPVMTVGEQIAEVLKLHGTFSERRCIELLDEVGIPDAARRIREYPHQLSGGMKQRVMIAMALAGNPGLLIADEPTTALDVTIQAQVLQLLRSMQEKTGMAMLLITHDLCVVAENADRIAVMYAGQIVEQASRSELFAHPLHPYTRLLLAALPHEGSRSNRLAAIAGTVPAMGSVRQGCRFATRCDSSWDKCRDQTPEWTSVSAGRGVGCHLYTQEAVAQKPLSMPVQNPTLPASFEKLLEVFDLRVHFPIRKGLLQRVKGQVKAVDGVSFEIGRGRTLALVGESGCGKTTLGKALLGLIQPSSGSVKLEGAMQMVFQDPYASLNPRMRVAEILEEGMSAQGIGGSRENRQEHIDGLLDKVGLLRDVKWRYPHEFSGGQRQRIAIARALAVSPELLICDEPTSALDVSVQAQILNLLKDLQQELKLAFLFITHNLAVVEYLADDVCVMYLGRIVERGDVESVLKNPRHPYTQALLSAVPRLDGARKKIIRLEGEFPSPANPPPGCHFAPRCTHRAEICTQTYPKAMQISVNHSVHCHFPPKALDSG